MGIPKADHQRISLDQRVILDFGDPDPGTDFDEFMQVSADIGAYATRAGRRPPGQPATTSDQQPGRSRGRRRAAVVEEIASFFILLVVAGNERRRATRSLTACWRCPAIPSNGTGGGLTSTIAHRGRGDRAVGLPTVCALTQDIGLRHQDGRR